MRLVPQMKNLSGWPLVAALLVPSVAGGATVTTSGSTTLAPSGCTNQSKVTVTFTADSESSSSTPTLELFATESSCPTPESGASTVTAPDDAVTLISSRELTSQDLSGSTATLAVRTMAGGDCSAQRQRTWHVCFYEFWRTLSTVTTSSSNAYTLASLDLSYDAQPPGAPVLEAITAGDEHLRVTFSAPGDDDVASYQVLLVPKSTDLDEAIATSATDAGSAYTAYDCYAGASVYDIGTDTSDAQVPGSTTELLTNGLTYAVQVRAVDAAGNVGPCSNPADGTPELINDFWRAYRSAGGASSGCASTGPSDMAPMLLSAAWLALARLPGRRRRAGIRS